MRRPRDDGESLRPKPVASAAAREEKRKIVAMVRWKGSLGRVLGLAMVGLDGVLGRELQFLICVMGGRTYQENISSWCAHNKS